MSGSRLRPYLGPVVALLVVLALGAGTVYAAIPNGSGTYYACLTKSSGVVRLINYPKAEVRHGRAVHQVEPAGTGGTDRGRGPAGSTRGHKVSRESEASRVRQVRPASRRSS